MQFIPDYARGKKDPSTVEYPHPLLEPILKETYGIIVYQEQVMECAKIVAGYTLGGADMLRRAMGKKDADAMAEERIKFVEGAKRVNNIDERKANEIFDLLNKFASYGFNKSHSAAYAVISYQTGYLKANYPVQFMAAVLTAELGNAEKVSHFVAEAGAMGLKVLGPDVNESRENFTPVVNQVRGEGAAAASDRGGPATNGEVAPPPSVSAAIRFGLAGIKGVGELAAQQIIAEREKNGPYADFADFAKRIDGRAINKRVLEHLVKTGAFDFSGASRKQLLEGIDAALAAAAAQARDRAAGQHSFLDMLADEPRGNGAGAPPSRTSARSSSTVSISADADFHPAERLAFEKELLGFYVTGHPMNNYAGLAEAIDTYPVADLLSQGDRVEFRLCGIASNLAKRLSKKDNRPWVSFTLATKNASVPLNMFADAFANYGHTLAENALVLVQGNILVNQEGARINVKECYPLDAQVAGLVRKVTWLLQPGHRELPGFLRQLREMLNQQAGDTRVEFAFVFEGRVAPFAEASNALAWKLNAPGFQQLRSHPAVVGVLAETRHLELKEERRWKKK
jgi:DNA polymerase-3 subunit alpha